MDNAGFKQKPEIIKLSALLRGLISDFPTVPRIIKNAILKFSYEILKYDIAFTIKATKSANHVVFNRKSIIKILEGYLYEPLLRLYPENSEAYLLIKEAGLLDISEIFSKSYLINLFKVIDRQDIIQGDFDNFYPDDNLIEATETLRFLYDVFNALNKHFKPSPKLVWCKLCFRRAPNKASFCWLHSPKLSDTKYRAANELYSVLNDEALKLKNKYCTQRLIFGESPNFYSEGQHFASVSEVNLASISLECIAQMNAIKTSNWTDIKQDIIEAIRINAPLLFNYFNAIELEASKSWPEFVKLIYQYLQEEIESTKEPYWVLKILSLAEAWLSCERNRKLCKPERKARDSKKNDILQLYNSGLVVKEIASQLGVSLSYVYNIIDKNFKTDGLEVTIPK